MLAENLVDSYKPVQQCSTQDQMSIEDTAMGENDISKSAELDVGKLKVVITLL
jgi:hypothetical protein